MLESARQTFVNLSLVVSLVVVATACSDDLRPEPPQQNPNGENVTEGDGGADLEDAGADTNVEELDAGDMGAPNSDDAGGGDDSGANDDAGGGDDAGDGPIDPIRICIADCTDQNPAYADQIDCDYDGLSNAEEAELGTDPCENDTDGDTLSDFEELQLGTDPLDADSDNDGADDATELDLELDPVLADTLADGVLDGDRWIVNACREDFPDRIDPTTIGEHVSQSGRWRLALPAAFDFTRLEDPAAPVDHSAGVFSDTTTEVAGFVRTYQAYGLNSAPDMEIQKVPFPSGSTLLRRTIDGEIETWDRNDAVRGRWQIRTNTPVTTRQFRDQMLDEAAPDWTGQPVATGTTYTEFQVYVTAIHRDESSFEQYAIVVAVAPLDSFDVREKVQFRMDDVTNTTNLAHIGDTIRDRCRPQNLQGERPKVDFYWVLDDSGSMEDYFLTMVNTAQDFFAQLQNTNLDYRLGVTSTAPSADGRIRPIPGWHTDEAAFTTEIYDYVCPGGNCIGGAEYGLENATLGIEYMYDSATPQAVRIRPEAEVITIVMTDEDAQSVKLAGGWDSPGGQALIDQYIDFFVGAEIPLYAIYNDGTCPGIGDNGESYRQVANASGGATALLCGNDLTASIEEILIAAAGRAGVVQLPRAPISSSLNVFKNGTFVPRSRVDGWDYFPGSRSIAFFGDARPRVVQPGERGDDIVISYSRYVDRSK